MSAREIIYDARFRRGTFKGYKIVVPHERLLDVFTTTLVEWGDHSDDVRQSVKLWLADKGPWKQQYGAFYFSREDTAAQFRLAYC